MENELSERLRELAKEAKLESKSGPDYKRGLNAGMAIAYEDAASRVDWEKRVESVKRSIEGYADYLKKEAGSK